MRAQASSVILLTLYLLGATRALPIPPSSAPFTLNPRQHIHSRSTEAQTQGSEMIIRDDLPGTHWQARGEYFNGQNMHRYKRDLPDGAPNAAPANVPPPLPAGSPPKTPRSSPFTPPALPAAVPAAPVPRAPLAEGVPVSTVERMPAPPWKRQIHNADYSSNAGPSDSDSSSGKDEKDSTDKDSKDSSDTHETESKNHGRAIEDAD